MTRLLIIVALLAIAAAFLAPRSVRTMVVAAVTALALIVAAVALYQEYSSHASMQRGEEAHATLVGPSLSVPAPRTPRTVSGRIRNQSQDRTITEVGLRVAIEDCLDDKCEVVAEQIEALHLEVPPGQARDFEKVISFPNLQAPRGEHIPQFEITYVKAR